MYFPDHIVNHINNYMGTTDLCVNKKYRDVLKQLSHTHININQSTLNTINLYLDWKFNRVWRYLSEDVDGDFNLINYINIYSLLWYVYCEGSNLHRPNINTTGWRSPIDLDLIFHLNEYIADF